MFRFGKLVGGRGPGLNLIIAEAEREKRAKIIHAGGEQIASDLPIPLDLIRQFAQAVKS